MLEGAFKLDRIDIRIRPTCSKAAVSPTSTWPTRSACPSPCLIRVKRLEKAGYVTGYGAHIELEKIGNVQLVFTQVTLSDHRREDFAKFEASIRKIDEIVECHLVSGGFDYLLKFVTTGVVHYQTIIEGLLDQHIGIEKYFSYIVIKSPFTKGYYPVEKLFTQNS